MAYTDFTVTSFGQAFVAQAMADAQNGTHKAILECVRYGKADASDPPSLDTLWATDSNPLVSNYGNNFSVRSHASNTSDTVSHSFDYIEIQGRCDGPYGVVGTIAYCKSDTVETIPPFDSQPVTKFSSIQFAVGADATVTLSANVVPGTMMQDEGVLCWPYSNAKAEIVNIHTDTLEPASASKVTVSGDAEVSGQLKTLSKFFAPNLPSIVFMSYTAGPPQVYDVWQDGIQISTGQNKSNSFAAVTTTGYTGAIFCVVGNGSNSKILNFNTWVDARDSGDTTASGLYFLYPTP